MGGPKIIEFSSMMSSSSSSSKTLARRTKAPRIFKKDSDEEQALTAVSKKDDTPQQQSQEGGFRQTVLFPALAALVVFITMKQLATGPKIWNAAKLLTTTVQQKVTQIKLKYQPVPVSSSNSNTSFALAKQESFGFFDYITDDDWKFRQYWCRARKDHAGDPTTDTENPKSWNMMNYYPSFSCPNLMRIGRSPNVGPRYVCDAHRLPQVAKQRNDNHKCLIYIVGNPWNFDFEDGLVQLLGDQCDVHVFWDGDLGAPKANMEFHSWKVSSSDAGGKTLLQSMKDVGHEGRVIDVLKVDCEGCEWTEYKDWLTVDARQILFEAHNTPPNANDLFSALLDMGYVIFAKEADMHPWHSRRHFLNVNWSLLKLDPNFSKGPVEKVGG